MQIATYKFVSMLMRMPLHINLASLYSVCRLNDCETVLFEMICLFTVFCLQYAFYM